MLNFEMALQTLQAGPNICEVWEGPRSSNTRNTARSFLDAGHGFSSFSGLDEIYGDAMISFTGGSSLTGNAKFPVIGSMSRGMIKAELHRTRLPRAVWCSSAHSCRALWDQLLEFAQTLHRCRSDTRTHTHTRAVRVQDHMGRGCKFQPRFELTLSPACPIVLATSTP